MEVNTHTNDVDKCLKSKLRAGQEHYSVPDGYFDGLTARIMANIPEEDPVEKPQSISWWKKVKPSLYLAASFVGLLLCFKGMAYVTEPTQLGRQAQATREVVPDADAEYISYYEDYATRLVGNEDKRQLDAAQYTYYE